MASRRIDDCIYIQLIDWMQALSHPAGIQWHAPKPKPRTMPASPCSAPETTLACIQRDFTEWRQGRTHYAVWALDADIAPIRTAMAGVCAHLGDCLLPGYTRQAHITLHLCGFPAASPVLPDDWPISTLTHQLQALSDMAPSPFTLEIGRADSFSSVPYLSVHDPEEGITALRRLLGEHDRTPEHPYVPHVTCGLYGGEFPMLPIREKLVACPVPTQTLPVTRLHLMAYEAALIGGPLLSLCAFDLETRRLQPTSLPAWASPFAEVLQGF